MPFQQDSDLCVVRLGSDSHQVLRELKQGVDWVTQYSLLLVRVLPTSMDLLRGRVYLWVPDQTYRLEVAEDGFPRECEQSCVST